MTDGSYDVVIVGGGVSGTALLYLLARYTDLRRLALVEKYDHLAAVNSKPSNNSQTLHCGDIETNYSLSKAVAVNRAAQMVVQYALGLPERDRILHRYSKMVLGVGEAECDQLRQRYEQFRPHFPRMRLLEKDAVAEIEPQVARGAQGGIRPEPLVALAVLDDYTAINYAELAQSFVEQARAVKPIELRLRSRVQAIHPDGSGHAVVTDAGTLKARFVVVSAGGHSLLFAHRLGYGRHYSCLPVAGSFYFTPQILNGKVYTVQNDKLPFAAIHGDPDVLVPGKTRFGPTALPLPLLERYDLATFWDYLQVLRPDAAVVQVCWDLFKTGDIRRYIFKNFGFEVPLLNRRLFLQDVRKIVPSLRLEDLEVAHGVGGIRPQLIDKTQKQLILGQAKIDAGDGILFNVTPSPGATYCLGNAQSDLARIREHLGCEWNQTAMESDLYERV